MSRDPGRQQTVAQQLLAETTYGQLARALSSADVEHLVLKGPHLAATVYDKPEDRPYSDLDILVRRGDLATTLIALKRAGFTLDAKLVDLPLDALPYDTLMVSSHGWLVEVHVALAPYALYRVDHEGLFDRAVPFRLGRATARGLCPEDLLCHLVIHAAKSHFRAIERKHITDVERVVARLPLRWEVAIERMRSAGCATAGFFMLSAAAHLDDAPVPRWVLASLSPSYFRRAWLEPWLTWRQFPLLRRPDLPKWLVRTATAPAMADAAGPALVGAARFVGRQAQRLRRHWRDGRGERGAWA
jgi:hypothetical protein